MPQPMPDDLRARLVDATLPEVLDDLPRIGEAGDVLAVTPIRDEEDIEAWTVEVTEAVTRAACRRTGGTLEGEWVGGVLLFALPDLDAIASMTLPTEVNHAPGLAGRVTVAHATPTGAGTVEVFITRPALPEKPEMKGR